jgi:hypothetical protein
MRGGEYAVELLGPPERIAARVFTVVGAHRACVTTATARALRSYGDEPSHGAPPRRSPAAPITSVLRGTPCESDTLAVAVEGRFGSARLTELDAAAETLHGAAATRRVRALPGTTAGAVTHLAVFHTGRAGTDVWLAGPQDRECARGSAPVTLYVVRGGRAVATHRGRFEHVATLAVGGRLILTASSGLGASMWAVDLDGDVQRPALNASVPLLVDDERCGANMPR